VHREKGGEREKEKEKEKERERERETEAKLCAYVLPCTGMSHAA
jgi:hypothetical protein